MASVRDRIAEVVGRSALLPPEVTPRWAVHGVVPQAVVAPTSDDEAAAVLELASAEGWAVEPAGAGGWLDAGRPPRRIDVVLTTTRMADAVEPEPADLVATAAAGVRLGNLADRLAPHRQWLPLDPPGHPEATLGAVASLAAAGPLREGHGTPRDHVLGLRLVTGDGRVLDLGGKVVKNVAGYDLVRLVVGSRGTLGLITRLHLRLRPIPERDATVAIAAPAPEPLVALAARIREERIEVAALEVVSGAGIGAAAGMADGAGGRAASWYLLVRLQGNAAAVTDAEARVERLAAGLQRDGRAAVWSALSVAEAGAALCVRLADAPTRLERTLRLALDLPGDAGAASAAGFAASGAGIADRVVAAHAGAGIVRVAVRAPDRNGSFEVERWARALADARAALAETGGTLIVARAPKALLEAVEPFPDPGPALRLMRQLKSKFDPAGVLSPGRFVV